MEENIIPFRRRDKGNEGIEHKTPQPSSQQAAHDNPDDEPLSPEEEDRIRSNIGRLMAENGLDVRRYSTLVGLIKTLVLQVPPQRQARLRYSSLELVRDYSIHDAIGLLNNASDNDISMKPMFYEALVLKIDNSRVELTRALRKRMREDHARRKAREEEV